MRGFYMKGEGSLIRAIIAQHVLDYWVGAGRVADREPHQALLEAYVLRHGPVHVNPRTIREVLDQLVRAKVLVRIEDSAHNKLYRLIRNFAKPTSIGFARNVTDQQKDPLPWDSETGDFLSLDASAAEPHRAYPLATFPHYFALHAWMRGYVHALNLGLFQTLDDDLRFVVETVREAPLRALWTLWEGREAHDEWAAAAGAFEETRLFRRTRGAIGRPEAVRRGCSLDGGVPNWAEEALVVLHQLCGHDHLRLFHGAAGRSTYQRLLKEEVVYGLLDGCILVPMLEKAKPWEGRYSMTALPPFLQERDPVLLIWGMFIPMQRHVEAHVRSADRSVRSKLAEHRLAWPGGLFSAAR